MSASSSFTSSKLHSSGAVSLYSDSKYGHGLEDYDSAGQGSSVESSFNEAKNRVFSPVGSVCSANTSVSSDNTTLDGSGHTENLIGPIDPQPRRAPSPFNPTPREVDDATWASIQSNVARERVGASSTPSLASTVNTAFSSGVMVSREDIDSMSASSEYLQIDNTTLNGM